MALVAKAVELAQECGCSHWWRNSFRGNPAEIALNKSCGFAFAVDYARPHENAASVCLGGRSEAKRCRKPVSVTGRVCFGR